MKWPFRSRIVKHGELPREHVSGSSPSLELIVRPISAHLGDPATVLHEIASEYVHIDVHVVAPRPGRDFYALVTSGMSDKPMNVPKQIRGRGLEFAELMLCLPSSWKPDRYDVVSSESWEKDWAALWLKKLARFPHEYNTWLSWGHSIPNGDPAVPLSSDTEMCGWILIEPKLVDDSFKCLVLEDGRKIFFHAVVPVYREEMAIKISEGAEKLEELFAEFEGTELIESKRLNVGLMQ